MSAHRVFGARFVALASLSSILALAGCSSSSGTTPVAANTGASTTAAPTAADRAPASGIVPAAAEIPSATSGLTVTCDAFAAQPKSSAKVHLKSGDVLAVTLCSNASTGFSWEPPVIAGDAVTASGSSTGMPAAGSPAVGAPSPALGAAPSAASGAAAANSTSLAEQGPGSPVGAASTTTFLLKASHAGSATVSFSYSRPWTGGEKNVWEYALSVTVD